MKRLRPLASGIAASFTLLSAAVPAEQVKPDLTTSMVKSAGKSPKAERAVVKTDRDPSRLYPDVKLPDYKKLQNRDRNQDITPKQLAQLMQVASSLGEPLSEFLSTGEHESAGTWNPHIKPPIEKGGLGDATGVWQFQGVTFDRIINNNGKKILELTKDMDLSDGTFTDAQVRGLLERFSDRKPKGGNGADRGQPGLSATAELLALRSNFVVSAYAKHYLGVESGGENPAARYCAHVTGSDLAYRRGAMSAYKNQVAADDFGAIANSNPSIFYVKFPDEPRTYAEVRRQLENLSADAIGSQMVRQKLGVGFDEGHTGANKPMKQLQRETASFYATGGAELRLPASLVYQGLDKSERSRFEKRFAKEVIEKGNAKGQATLTPPETIWLTASLKRHGVLPQDTAAQDFNDPRIKQALAAFQDRIGIQVAPENRGLLTPAVKVALGLYNERIDALAKTQLGQKQSLAAPDVLDLKKLSKLGKDDPARLAAEPKIIALKEALAEHGLLTQPGRTEIQTKTGKHGQKIRHKVHVALPFDAQIDGKVLTAFSAAQLRHGLVDNGVLDRVSMQILRGEAIAPYQPQPAPAAADAKPQAPTRSVSGKIDGGPAQPFNSSALTPPAEERISLAALSSALETAPVAALPARRSVKPSLS